MYLSGSNYIIFTTIYIHYTPKQRNIRLINKHSHHTFRCTAYSDFLVIIHLPIERPLPLPKVSINCTVIWCPDLVSSKLVLVKANSDDVLNDEADKLAKLGATSPYIIIINKDIDRHIINNEYSMGNSIMIDRNIWKTMRLFNTLTCFHRNQELGSSRHLWTCHHNFLLNAILYSNGYQTSTGLPSRIYHWYTRYCLEFFNNPPVNLMVAGDLKEINVNGDESQEVIINKEELKEVIVNKKELKEVNIFREEIGREFEKRNVENAEKLVKWLRDYKEFSLIQVVSSRYIIYTISKSIIYNTIIYIE
ncbi:unnamed protein product [Rhizophagus irregularis]|uniref:Uncharacterized protein n=1 Tax=Rhizophagus irregularis TaxID=588596 RepID=A0A915YQM4_9GLOM|nr:unnamed protein product [Rhizophagus irregularis]